MRTSVGRRAEHHHRVAQLLAHGVRDVAQAVRVEVRLRPNDDLHAVALLRAPHEPLDIGAGTASLRPLLQLLHALGEAVDRVHQLVLGHPQPRRELVQPLGALPEQARGLRSGDRLDAADVRGARGLGRHVEQPDLRGGRHVRAAAQLARDALDLHHAHTVAVLLAEERHGAEPLGLVTGRLDRADAVVRGEPAANPLLDLGQVLWRQPLPVREVEAQLVGTHVRAGLAHVISKALAERRVQEVGGGVVAHGGEPAVALHDRVHRLSLAEFALDRLEREGLVVAHPIHVDHLRATRRRLHQPAVGDLASALRIEGAFLELGEQPAVRSLRDAQDGLGLRFLVAHEARAEARLAREAEHVLVLHVHGRPAAGLRARAGARAAGARDLAGALHQLLEALVVNRQALLGEQLLGHLVGEAEGVVELEGVLGGDPGRLLGPGPLDQLGQQPLTLVERAAEALLLRLGPALDRRPLRVRGRGTPPPSPRARARTRARGTAR